MLKPRIIPLLLIDNDELIKTVGFTNPKYVGDPINAVRIFNEKQVDEIVILDIGATRDGKKPNYKLIKAIAQECRMPLCIGGGVNSVNQIEDIISFGVEKVAISSSFIKEPSIIEEGANRVGSQSIVVVLDVKRHILLNKYSVYINNGNINTKMSPIDLAIKAQNLGAGEIIINSISREVSL